MSNLNVLEKVRADQSILKILEMLSSGILTEPEAYELICESFRNDLRTFSANENLRNVSIILNYIDAKLLPSAPLSKLTILWLKDGIKEPLSDEADFIYAVPRGCAVILKQVAEYGDTDELRNSASQLSDYIEALGILPKPEEVIGL
jgi:hypothetical protein